MSAETLEAQAGEPTLEQKVQEIVSHHAPDEEQIKKMVNVRESAKYLILTIMRNCPPSADRSAAVRKAREAMMTANASIVVPAVQL